MPDFSFDSLQSFLTSWRSAITWLFQCIVGVFDVIKSSPLYYIPLLLVCIIGIVGGIALLIFDISDRGYSQNLFSSLKNEYLGNRLNYGYINSSPFFPTFINNYKKRKRQQEIENQKAQEAYERVVEEQAALENGHRLYIENQKKAAEFFKHNPGRYKVTIDKMDFYNDDKAPWYMKKYSYNGNSDESSKPSYDLDEAVRKATVRAKDLKE